MMCMGNAPFNMSAVLAAVGFSNETVADLTVPSSLRSIEEIFPQNLSIGTERIRTCLYKKVKGRDRT